MQPYPPTVIVRHRKENLKKCSLTGLEDRSDMRFFSYPNATWPCLDDYVFLSLDAPPLSAKDASHGLLILDATWRKASVISRVLDPYLKNTIKRSLPSHYHTAYPRRQDDCLDPDHGLASVEALFLAYLLLGRDTTGLLDHYYWKDAFLQKNLDF